MVALEPAWIGVIGTGIGALASGIPALATAVVQSRSARHQRRHDAEQARAEREASAAEAKAQRDYEETKRQRAIIAEWRAGIASLGNAGLYASALQTPWYETLRPYLTSDVVARLERPNTVLVMPDSPRGSKNLFTGEVDRIEREWRLRP